MIAILRKDASPEAVEHPLSWIEKKGLQTNYSKGENETVIGLVGDTTKIDPFLLESMTSLNAYSASPSPSRRPTASSIPRTPSSIADTVSRSAAATSR